MDDTTTLDADIEAPPSPSATEAAADDARDAVEDELLIEEVSIDGMCGVY